MLSKGLILLSSSIDLLIQMFKNVLVLILVNLAFRSRWTWQVILPSLLVYYFPNIKAYIQRLMMEIQGKGKLELLLSANSLSQHVLFLIDRLLWLYNEEIDFCAEALKGNLSFEARLLIIGGIILISGFLNMSPLISEALVLHLLLKHSKLGAFYRDIFGSILGFIDFAWYYKYFHKQKLPPPFDRTSTTITIYSNFIIRLNNIMCLFLKWLPNRADSVPDFLYWLI